VAQAKAEYDRLQAACIAHDKATQDYRKSLEEELKEKLSAYSVKMDGLMAQKRKAAIDYREALAREDGDRKAVNVIAPPSINGPVSRRQLQQGVL
jgi:hypothetical protein